MKIERLVFKNNKKNCDIKLKKSWSFLILGCFIIALSACNKSPEKSLVGTWVNTEDLGAANMTVGNAETIEIYEDGTFEWTWEDSSSSATYQIIHDGTSIEMAENNNAHVIFDFSIDGDELELTVVGGNDNQGNTYYFTKE